MDHIKQAYLEALGIQVWESKQEPNIALGLEQPGGLVENAEPQLFDTVNNPQKITDCSSPSSSIDMETLRQAVAACQACSLHKSRRQTVFGVGKVDAELMIIGEAPGENEDKQGKPFVGRAGQLLTAMLESINFPRESVYIANILKCRPPSNRDPAPEEVDLCTGFLKKQIALIQPKLLLAVGRIAAQYLLQTKTAVSQLRGKLHQYEGIPLIVSFHPAYLLRSPKEKSKAYLDLQSVSRFLSQNNSSAHPNA